MTGRVLVVGDVVTDIVAVPSAPLSSDSDTAARIRTRPGGSAANTAVWAAYRGASVRMLGRVGADSVDWHYRHLAEHGVEPVLRVDTESPTAVVIALIAADGERGMVTDRGAGAALGPSDWDDALLDDVAHVHLSGYLWFAEPGARLADRILDTARRRGLSTSVDPASTGFLREHGVAEFLARIRGTDLLFPNADEARLLSGHTDVDRAAADLARHFGLVAVTLGADGALLAEGTSPPVRSVAPTVDVTDLVGAGDAFAGAFLAAWLAGADPRAACEVACQTGSMAVGCAGGRPPARG